MYRPLFESTFNIYIREVENFSLIKKSVLLNMKGRISEIYLYNTSVYIMHTLVNSYSVANCDSCLVKKSVLGGRNFSL